MLLDRDWNTWHNSTELDPWHDAICPGFLVTGWNLRTPVTWELGETHSLPSKLAELLPNKKLP